MRRLTAMKTTDLKATLALCLICAALSSLALAGLAHGSTPSKTLVELERVHVHTTDKDEDQGERKKRLTVLAAAIDLATASLDERAWLIMTATRESGLARYVTEDHPRCSEGHGGWCDSGRAFGAWQLHATQRDLTHAEQALHGFAPGPTSAPLVGTIAGSAAHRSTPRAGPANGPRLANGWHRCGRLGGDCDAARG